MSKLQQMINCAKSHQQAIDAGLVPSAHQRFNRAANYFPRKAQYPNGKHLAEG